MKTCFLMLIKKCADKTRNKKPCIGQLSRNGLQRNLPSKRDILSSTWWLTEQQPNYTKRLISLESGKIKLDKTKKTSNSSICLIHNLYSMLKFCLSTSWWKKSIRNFHTKSQITTFSKKSWMQTLNTLKELCLRSASLTFWVELLHSFSRSSCLETICMTMTWLSKSSLS